MLVNSRFLYLLAVTVFGGTTISFAQSARRIDVSRYSFSIELSNKTDSITGRARISFTATDSLSVVNFDLANLNADGKGMIVKTVSWKLGQPLKYIHAGNLLTIYTGTILKKNDTATIHVEYSGIPADGLIISKSKFGKRTFFSDNWPNRAQQWIPCNDDPSDKAAVEFYILAPQEFEVVSNGIEIGRTTQGNNILSHWKEDIPLPTKIMVIGVADFAIRQTDTVRGIPVSSWVFPENKNDGFVDYAPATPILEFFIDYLGPYPYKKLANVQSKTVFGGMENASTIFYYENYINGKQDQKTLIAHEIAHQWFGDMVTEKSFAHLWLSEGFATYLAVFYNEKTFGPGAAKDMLEEDRQQVIAFARNNNTPVVDSSSSYMDLLNANSYQKGGWILHMLRQQLGDTVFQQCVRAYYNSYAGKNAETKDLQRVFEKVSGKDLDSFFRQWLFSPGLPKLDIQWSYSETAKQTSVTIKQLQKTTFNFPLEILIRSGGDDKIETINITQPVQTFQISSQLKPLRIQADPNVKLLFEGKVNGK